MRWCFTNFAASPPWRLQGKGLGGDRVSQLRAGALGAGPAASRKDGRVVLARSGGSGPGRGSPRPGRPVASRLRGGSGP